MSTNLDINKNTDYTRTFTVMDTNNTVINLNGFTMSSQLRRTPLSTASVSFTMSFIDAAAGKVQMFLPHSITNTLEGKYFYDIFLTDPSSLKFKIEDGLIFIHPNITQ
jgi:hypothetical protein